MTDMELLVVAEGCGGGCAPACACRWARAQLEARGVDLEPIRRRVAAAEKAIRALPDKELADVGVAALGPDPDGLWRMALREMERRGRK